MYENRLRNLKAFWMEIQTLREEQQINRKKIQELLRKQKQIGQELPKKLNQFNEMMV